VYKQLKTLLNKQMKLIFMLVSTIINYQC